MKKILALIIILSFSSTTLVHAQEAASLNDINYHFDVQKLEASDDSFHFVRSFVDYYYGLMAKNASGLHIAGAASSFSGWCVGDAHAENFGILLQDNSKALFTMNDMDDFGPCPLAYDFFRLLVSSRLYLPKIDIEKLKSTYLAGLKNENIPVPKNILSLADDGEKLGMAIGPKKLDGNKLKRKKEMDEVSSDIKNAIIANLNAVFFKNGFKSDELKVVDVVSTTKRGGGSGGLLRYEVLCLKGNDFIHLELKELTTPSIAPVATATIPPQSERMNLGLQIEQGANHSRFYNVFKIGDKTMLLRPKFSGNLGVSLSDSSEEDNMAIIAYEAFILGRIHAESAQAGYKEAMESLSQIDLESDVASFTHFLEAKFSELKKMAPVSNN
ncbi:MAG: DUF2252 family protein [Bacteriovorax sp.]